MFTTHRLVLTVFNLHGFTLYIFCNLSDVYTYTLCALSILQLNSRKIF